MNAMPPILLADLFPEVSQHLLTLLSSLTLDEWNLPTSSSGRRVKDIASHLLDGSLRRLSFQRDGYSPSDGGPRSAETLLEFLNRLNSEWEKATRRLSPLVLIDFIERADRQLADLFESLDPFAPAPFAVAWTGEQQSPNWMDVAREFTEKWHHTQQIFEATRRPSTITVRRLFHPCLDTFMRALAFTFRNVATERGTSLAVVVIGEAGGTWYVERANSGWQQVARPTTSPRSTVTLDQISAWKLVTKCRRRQDALAKFPDLQIDGDVELGSHIAEMLSMMA